MQLIQGSRGAGFRQQDAMNNRVDQDLNELPTSMADGDLNSLPVTPSYPSPRRDFSRPRQIPGVTQAGGFGGMYDDYNGDHGDLPMPATPGSPYAPRPMLPSPGDPGFGRNWLAPSYTSPGERPRDPNVELAGTYGRADSQASIAEGNAQVAESGQRVKDAENLLAATVRGDTPWATQPNPTMPAYTMGTDSRIPLNPAAVNTQIDDFLDRRHTADQARGYAGPDGRRTPLGQMPGNYATTQRVGTIAAPGAPNPNRYTEADDGLPGGSTAFGPVMPSRNGLANSMDQYALQQDAQRQRLAARGKNPEEIANLMGGPRPGPDLSVVRAVNQANVQSGMNPRLSASLALDAGGGPAQGGTTMALRDLIMGGNQLPVDPLRQAMAGTEQAKQEAIRAEIKRQAGVPIVPPEGTTEYDKYQVDRQNKMRDLKIADPTQPMDDADLAYSINQANQGAVVNPKLDAELRKIDEARFTGGDNQGGTSYPLSNYLDGEGDFVKAARQQLLARGINADEAMLRKWYQSKGNQVGSALPGAIRAGLGSALPAIPWSLPPVANQ